MLGHLVAVHLVIAAANPWIEEFTAGLQRRPLDESREALLSETELAEDERSAALSAFIKEVHRRAMAQSRQGRGEEAVLIVDDSLKDFVLEFPSGEPGRVGLCLGSVGCWEVS